MSDSRVESEEGYENLNIFLVRNELYHGADTQSLTANARAKGVVLVRVLKLEDAPLEKRTTGSVRWVVDKRIGASRLGVIFVEISAGAAPSGSHYHTKRESVYIGVESRARAIIDGREHIVEPDTVVFISPSEKHRLENIWDTAFKMI